MKFFFASLILLLAVAPCLKAHGPPAAGGERIRLGSGARCVPGSPLSLLRGAVLFSSRGRLWGRKPEEVLAGPLSLSCAGTALVSIDCERLKVTCLEGTVTVWHKGRRGRFIQLKPGAMLLMDVAANDLPRPVEVNLERLVATSNLLRDNTGLEAAPEIAKEIARQRRSISKGRLVATNMEVEGSGGLTRFERGSTDGPEHGIAATASVNESGAAGGGNAGGSTAGQTSNSPSAGPVASGVNTALNTSFVCETCVAYTPRSVPMGSFTLPEASRNVHIVRSEAEENAISVPSTGTVSSVTPAVDSNVSPPGTSTSLIPSNRAGTVYFNSSTQLADLAQLSILAPQIESFHLSDCVYIADGSPEGNILNFDATNSSGLTNSLTISRSLLVADIIKARSFSTGDRDTLIIDGSRFNAQRLIRLYAEGGGTLRFRGQVELQTPLAQLAGRRVSVDPGSHVQASGTVRVYADYHEYNAPGFGSIKMNGQQETHPFAVRPNY